ncbi:MAG TPA: hypothetical protein VFE07_14785 [Marmoricola sp.]|nr:hypothetical protein [Marmoricola sp.]
MIATVIGVVALIWIVLYVVREQVAHRQRIDEALHSDNVPTLEYVVPTGQDPTVILAALERAGFTATSDPHHANQRVLIACPEGLDRQRAHVRSVIESASVTAPQDGVPIEADVQFVDER